MAISNGVDPSPAVRDFLAHHAIDAGADVLDAFRLWIDGVQVEVGLAAHLVVGIDGGVRALRQLPRMRRAFAPAHGVLIVGLLARSVRLDRV
ncbi:MAG: hypothetical protein QM756_09405 [Polyangiaceae bacterium]